MEKEKRKHLLFDHPFLGGLVAMFIIFYVITTMGIIPELGLEVIKGLTSDGTVSDKTDSLIHGAGEIMTVVAALICLLVHNLWFRKDGYKGTFLRSGLKHKESWLFVLFALLIDVIITAINAVHAGIMPVMPTVTVLLLALRAGVSEEAIYRGASTALMMKNNPSYKRMWVAVIVTSFIFGFIHMANAGSENVVLVAAFIQSVNALCFGLLFAAIYLRSGNILLSMALHMLHDVISMMDPSQATGLYTTSSFSAKDFVIQGGIAALYVVAAIIMLRKSKWEEIKSTWANIWAE